MNFGREIESGLLEYWFVPNGKKKRQPVSVIVALLEPNDYLRETFEAISRLKLQPAEVIVLPNRKPPAARIKNLELRIKKEGGPPIRWIATARSEPSIKRNIGVQKAKSEIVAFLDDDSYPVDGWLERALPHFKDKRVVGVGGPAITPESDDFLKQVSGAVFESFLGGGTARHRYLSLGRTRPTDDWPTVNLLVRKESFTAAGGFDKRYWPGEDTKLCFDLVKKGGQIVYQPDSIVYHHRRSDLSKHLRQILQYGKHRGHFARLGHQTSLRFGYLLPSLFLLYLIGLLILLLVRFPQTPLARLLTPLGLYGLGLIIDGLITTIRHRHILIGLTTIVMIPLTHISYGLGFILGLFQPPPRSVKDY